MLKNVQNSIQYLPNKIDELLKVSKRPIANDTFSTPAIGRNNPNEQNLLLEKIPQKRLDHLILPDIVRLSCQELINEQSRF